jgi:hypothetical protein
MDVSCLCAFSFFTFRVAVVFGLSCLSCHVMSGCLGRRCFNADGGRRCRCFVVSSCACVMRRRRLRAFLLRLFFLWLVFFLLFFAFVGPGMVQGQSWGYATGWDRVQVRRQKMSRRCQRLSRIVFVSSDTRAPPSHPNIGCCSCFCLSASLAASPSLPAAPCPVNAARTTHHTPQTHHPVSSAAQPSPSRILHPANSLTRPLTCLTPHVHRRHVSRTSIPFSPPAGPPLPWCVALGRLVCATLGFEGAGGRGSSQGPRALIAGTRWYLGRSPGLHCCDCCALPWRRSCWARGGGY